jgi:geranyl-CoA carboxylase beta subunit
MEQGVVDTMEAKSRALVNTARVWDDGIIDPRDTREVLACVLEVCRDSDSREVQSNSWGVARF